MQIYVISLKHALNRRDLMSKQLDNLGLSYEFIDAVDGRQLTTDEMNNMCDMDAVKQNPAWLTPGAIGCAISHKIAYEKLLCNNQKTALILEDDMILPQSLDKILKSIESQIVPGEVVLLHYKGWNVCRFSNYNKRLLDDRMSLVFPLTINDIPITTGAYVMSYEACKTLCELLPPIRVAADSWRFFLENDGIKCLSCVYPRIVEDACFKSTVDYDALLNPILASALKYIDKNKVFFLYQLLKYRRKLFIKKMSQFRVVDEQSKLCC